MLRVVEQYVPHGLRCDGEEVRAALPVDAVETHEAKERLMHEVGSTERVVGALVAESPARHSTQLVVDVREQPIERRGIASGVSL